jgi:WhiB family redox-sensing transcriptional regulator
MGRESLEFLSAFGFKDQDWRAFGACLRQSADDPFRTNEFFETALIVQQRAAKAVCATCPVQDKCRAWALDHRPPYGIWGGMTIRELERLRRRRQYARRATLR